MIGACPREDLPLCGTQSPPIADGQRLDQSTRNASITSYNVCYTKLLRGHFETLLQAEAEGLTRVVD